MTTTATPIAIESGCKVGWEIYDDEAVARERGRTATNDGYRKAEQGYDFGYCVPGEVRHVEKYVSRHVNDDGSRDKYENVWVVTIP